MIFIHYFHSYLIIQCTTAVTVQVTNEIFDVFVYQSKNPLKVGNLEDLKWYHHCYNVEDGVCRLKTAKRPVFVQRLQAN